MQARPVSIDKDRSELIDPVFLDASLLEKPLSMEMKQNAELKLLAALANAFLQDHGKSLTLLRRIQEEASELVREEFLDALAGGQSEATDFQLGGAREIARHVKGERVANELVVEDAFRLGLVLLQVFKAYPFPADLSDNLFGWSQEVWSNIINQQQFRLRNPAHSVPRIRAALAEQGDAYGRTARVLLAAADAVRIRIDQSYRDYLRSVALA